jgi:hypothetical protein
MMRRSIALALVVALVGGCAKKNPYLGEWEGEVTAQSFRVPVVHKFSPDGAYEVTGELMGAKVKITGTYEWGGDKLTVSGSTVAVDTSGSMIPKDLIDKGTTEIAKQLNKPQTGTVSWTDKDTFVATPDEPANPILRFKRKVASK